MRIFLILGWLVFGFLSVAFSSPSARADEPRYRAGLVGRYFDYLEGDNANDSEKGSLFGLSLGYDQKIAESLTLQGRIELTSGHTVYDGSNQNHTVAVSGQTPTQIYDFEFDGTYLPFEFSESTHVETYLGIGYHYWRRGDAQVISGVSSYRENYTWWQIPIGVRFVSALSDTFKVTIDGAIIPGFAGNLFAVLSGIDSRLPDLNFKLGSIFEWRIQAPIEVDLGAPMTVVVNPWYQHISIGTGDPILLSGTNGSTVQLHEPSSRTKEYGLTLSAVFSL